MIKEKKYIEENRQVYNTIAEHFSSTREHIWKGMADFLPYFSKKMNVLDIGCGNGRVYHMLDGLSISYTGLDQSTGLLKEAKKKFPAARFVEGEMTHLPFAAKEFDIIVCIATFHHLPTEAHRLRALREMKRVLQRGGRILMMNWNLTTPFAKKNIQKGKWKTGESAQHMIVPWMNDKKAVLGNRHYWAYSLKELRSLAEQVGVTVEKNFIEKNKENIITIFSKP